MMIKKKLILASASPRRHVLLKQIGLTFEVRESGVREDNDVPHDPEQHTLVLSRRKARAVASHIDEGIVIGADTIVVFNGQILNKPKDGRIAARMLQTLSGQWHEVYTGFTLVDRPSDSSVSAVERTRVKFRLLAIDEIEAYIQSGSPMDKAGAYGIQDDYGAVFVERIEGCFYNVVGFPLTRFYLTMQEFQHQLGIV
jgi:septum formation protein